MLLPVFPVEDGTTCLSPALNDTLYGVTLSACSKINGQCRRRTLYPLRSMAGSGDAHINVKEDVTGMLPAPRP